MNGIATVNDVRMAVVSALNEHFPDIDIYGEEIKQGLEEPCFFVKLFPVSQDREFNRRYTRSHSFDIHFFAKINRELHEVAEQLYDCMEYITINGSKIRGKGMRHEIIDGVLHFFIDFDFHVLRKKQSDPKMQTLEQEEYLKNG